jgi:hypothetical protein
MRPWRRADRGAATITVAITASCWVVLLALIVVGGGRIRALQRADNIAAEAARAAGSAIDTGRAVPGGPKVVDPVAAQQAALDYMRDAGATGSVTVDESGTGLSIVVNIEYPNPTGFEWFGGASWTATGDARVVLLVG